jgi:hypothetical protein
MKFGESLLHKSEVMLKDLADSKRVHEFVVKQMVCGGFVFSVWNVSG